MEKKTSELKKLRSKHCEFVTESAWARGGSACKVQLAFNWAILHESLIRRQVKDSLQTLFERGYIVDILPYFGNKLANLGNKLANLDSFLYDVAPTMSAYANIAQTIDERIAGAGQSSPMSILDLIIEWLTHGKRIGEWGSLSNMLLYFEGYSFNPNNFPKIKPPKWVYVVQAEPVRFPSLRF